MAAEEKILEVGRESHETPQAITITIVDPSALDGNTLSTSLVTSVEAQDDDADPGSSIVMVSGEGPKSILQTVTETHMGDEELPIISNISNPDEEEELEDEETVVDMNKVEAYDAEGEEAEAAESFEAIGLHCLICNLDLATVEEDEHIPVFKTQTSTTHRKLAVFLGSLTGQKLTSRKAHSDILCRRCFSLLDRVDSLEVEIKETKEEIVNKYQETVSAYGGRARRRKPTTAKKTDYVFPKVEPEDEADQLLEMELDGNFEPQVEDLMEEDPGIQDEEWEPEFKKPRIKRESSEIDSTNGPPKRKRGRPRKDATKPKGAATIQPPESLASCSNLSPDLQGDENPLKVEEKKALWSIREDAQEHLQEVTTVSSTKDATVPLPLAWQCPSCFVPFFTKADLRSHFKGMHSDIKVFRCLQCSVENTGDFEAFLIHCKTHQDEEGGQTVGHNIKTRECRVCHKVVRASGYAHHVATHKPVSCPRCNLQLAPRNLKRHINYCHTKAMTYPCTDCSAVYHDASNLLSHRKRNHLGQEVRRHLCEVCGKKFITPSDLRTHVAGVHHNVKKFVCEYCGLSFKISSALMYHRRMHTGEKPHACQVCERTFMKPNALAKHVRRVHGLEYHGKYRKRIQAPEPSSKGTLNQTHQSPMPPEHEGSVDTPELQEEQVVVTSISPALKEATSHEADAERLRVTAVYSLSQGVVQVPAPLVVNVEPSQSIQNLTYFRPTMDDRAVPRPYEATTSLHTITYYRQSSDEQYTMAELLPPQSTQEHTHRPYPGTSTSPDHTHTH